MRFCVLGSGSKGNCTYVAAGRTHFLIDAGFSAIEIERRLAAIGILPESLGAIFVTHEHTDHIRGVSVLSRRYRLPVYATQGTFHGAGHALEKVHARTVLYPGTPHTYNDVAIHPFAISHDAAEPIGFVVRSGIFSLGYCTDTGVISRLIHHRLSSLNALILECNHDLELLKNGPYPPHLQQRIRSKTGHLANADAVTFLMDIQHDSLEHVVLAHISEANNSHQLVRDLVKGATQAREEDRALIAGCRITLAHQDEADELVCLLGVKTDHATAV